SVALQHLLHRTTTGAEVVIGQRGVGGSDSLQKSRLLIRVRTQLSKSGLHGSRLKHRLRLRLEHSRSFSEFASLHLCPESLQNRCDLLLQFRAFLSCLIQEGT